jgi:hypothetical protein
MVKSFLILMLMTIQLLVGNGGSVSVCIKGDGSFCCFKRGPSDCTHCDIPEVEIAQVPKPEVPKPEVPKPEVPTEPPGCHCCCNEVETPCPSDAVPESEQFVQSMVNSVDPCGCTQIVLTQDHSLTSVARTFPAADANRMVLAAFDVPAVFGSDAAIAASQTAFQRFKPPPVSSQTITVLSWVLIQC